MTESWNHVYVPDPTLGDGYVSVIKQIWDEIALRISSVVPENNLANIILDYAGVNDFYVFSRVLGIHIPGAATLTNWAHTYDIYLGSRKSDFPSKKSKTTSFHGHSMSRMGYIHVVATNGTWHLEAKEKRFDIDLREMFQRVQARDYIGIAKYMKSMLYKSYRPNHDKLGTVAATCAEVMELHAKIMLQRMTRYTTDTSAIEKSKKRAMRIDETDAEIDTLFWSIFKKKKSYLEAFEQK